MRAAPVALALVTFVGIFAGCLSTHDDPVDSPVSELGAHLLCYMDGEQELCNFEATRTPDTRQANELSIAVNPTDPNNIIATGKDYTPEEAGDCVWSGLYTTKDGGRTWKNQNVPGSPWKKLQDPMATVYPTTFSRFWCATDPVVSFSADGKTAYWTVMPYQCDRLSGSKTGRDVVPENPVVEDQGGLNDWFWTCSSMYVLVSHDGGETWPEWQEVAFGPRLEHDKQWIATAPNGDVLLCWDRDTSYQSATGTAADQLNPGGNVIVCAVSHDEGKSWTDPTTANEDWIGYLPALEYDANSVAYMVALDNDHVIVSKSADGLLWSPPVVVGDYKDPQSGGEYGWPVVEGSDFRIFAVPMIAIDRSDGPYSGSIYVTWFTHGVPEHAKGKGDILVSYSRDGGETWSPPAKPYADNETRKIDRFMPAISADPNGTVDLSWYDRRDDPANHLFDLYFSYSKDGGQSWAQNLRVSEVSSDEQFSHHQNGMVFLGDYRDQDSTTQGAHLVWVDTRNQKADVYVATVLR